MKSSTALLRNIRNYISASWPNRSPRRGQPDWVAEQLEERRMLSGTDILAGNIDGDTDFDANDSFLIHLTQLAAVDAQIEQSKGASLLTTSKIRDNIRFIGLAADVDGDNDIDANDSFLIHLTKLAGTNTQINLAKGPSGLSAALIRAKVENLAKLITPPLLQFGEGSDFSLSETISLDLSNPDGTTRLIRIEFDSNQIANNASSVLTDQLNIYLRRSDTSRSILLSDADSNTPLFSQNNSTTEILNGSVRFNGEALEILVPPEINEPNAELEFQLLSLDQNDKSVVTIRSVTLSDSAELNTPTNGIGIVQPAVVGNSIDVTNFGKSDSLQIEASRIRFDLSIGDLKLNLRLKNNGPPIGSAAVIAFPDLPAGVQLATQSGVTTEGVPYLNAAPAILRVLETGGTSLPIAVEFSNPDNVPLYLTPEVLVRTANTPPTIDLPDTITLSPGHKLTFELPETDVDGDRVIYQFNGLSAVPSTTLTKGHQVGFSPAPSDVGSYSFQLTVSDGFESVSKDVSVQITDNKASNTRLSGYVFDVDFRPLVSVPVEIGITSTQTDSEGHFVLDGPLTDFGDTLIVRGEAITGDNVYPFIAERLPLVLSHSVYEGYENQLGRPIFLPILDLDNGSMVDSTTTTVVSVPLVENEAPAAVTVAPGSLMDQQGQPFNGILSITEVPIERTPAALPPALLPDTVVTIQPGDMVFETPAPLTLPNRAGVPAGTLMDLWSISPVTGDFEIVGQGQVSADETVVETISGGIRNSSWHAFTPPGETTNPDDDPRNPEEGCKSCKAKGDSNSDVILHSGAYNEYHDLTGYQSLGTSIAPRLVYDSESAGPRPIVTFGAEDTVADPDVWLTGTVSANNSNYVTRSSEHFWRIPEEGGDIAGAIQLDLSDAPTGIYNYFVRSSLSDFGPDGDRSGAATIFRLPGSIVNHSGSIFGAGWSMTGLQEIIEPRRSISGGGGGGTTSGDVLFVDGNSESLVFEFGTSVGGSTRTYESPAGDFSTLERKDDFDGQRYIRTMKDGTVYEFRPPASVATSRGPIHFQLTKISDRVGRITTYEYHADGRILRMRDPVGLETAFLYENGKVATITSPESQTTSFQYDANGNLIRITDPDGTFRTFEYDHGHRLTAEIDKRGSRQEQVYDFAGRIIETVRADGVRQQFSPVQTQFLLPPNLTATAAEAPDAFVQEQPVASYTDPNGNLISVGVNRQQEAGNTLDSLGVASSIQRNAQNLPETVADGNQNQTDYAYDERGNVTQINELGKTTQRIGRSNQLISTDSMTTSIVVDDFNNDGIPDIASSSLQEQRISVRLGLGGGTFADEQTYATHFSHLVLAGDLNNDGFSDLVTPHANRVSVLLNQGDGTFLPEVRYTSPRNDNNTAVLGDLDSDGWLDIVTGSDDGPVTIFMNAGDGTYLNGNPIDMLTRGTRNIGIVDVDTDGNLDLIATGISNAFDDSDNIVVRRGLGDGTFSQKNLYFGADGIRENGVTYADINGDDVVDILMPESDYVRVSPGNNDGTFGTPFNIPLGFATYSLEVADFNSDGVPDIAATGRAAADNHVGVLLGLPDGTFQEADFYTVQSGSQSVKVADINGDGADDLVVANTFSRSISTLTGNGDGTFTNRLLTGGNPGPIALGDFDGVRGSDVVVANQDDNSLSVFLKEGSRRYSTQTTVTLPQSPTALATGDLNGDGLADQIVGMANSSEALGIVLGTTTGTFEAPTLTALPVIPTELLVDDFTGDGVFDVAVIGESSSRVYVLINDGTGNLSAPIVTELTFQPRAFTTTALNGDNAVDLAIVGGTDSFALLTSDGDGTFSVASEVAVAGSPSLVVSQDFDNDGSDDFVVTGSQTNVLATIANTSGNAYEIITTRLLAATQIGDLQAADFDQDGNADVALIDPPSNAYVIFFGDGNGAFPTASTFIAGVGPSRMAIGTFNTDRVPDVFLVNSGSNDVLISESLRPFFTSQERHFEYDPTFNQLTRYVDELGRETLYDISPANGNVLETRRVVGADDRLDSNTEADDIVTTYTYTGLGLVDLQTEFVGTVDDPKTRVTDFDYDQFGRLTTVVFAKDTVDEASQRFDYDAAGNQTDVWDENGNHTQYVYDSMNRLTQITEPDPDGDDPLVSPVTRFEYDENGNLKATVDAEGNRTVNQYDELDRLYRTIGSDPDGLGLLEAPVTQFAYDNVGNLTRTIDPLGNETRNRYDSRNRLVETTDPDGGVTGFTYDGNDNLTSLTDPVDNTTRFEYDARDRLTAEIDPLEKITRYEYDAVDNLVRKTDRLDRVTEFQYDELDRLFQEDWLAADGSQVNQIDYVYDKASNLLSVQDSASALAFTYDDRDRVDTVDNAGTPGATQVLLEYGYDGVGNVTSVTDSIAGQAGAVTGYEYDALNRVTMITQTGNDVSDKRVDFAYNQLGQYDEITRYFDLDGTQLVVATDYEYDDLNRLTDLVHNNGTTDVAFYRYQYDSASRISQIVDIDGVTDYSYDDRSQLTGADRANDDSRGDESYEYDANGNRVSSHLHGDGYVTDVNNRLTSDGTYTYAYDDEGNMVLRTAADGSTRTLEYDHRNRLTAVIDRDGSGSDTQFAEYVYDATDRRILKSVATGEAPAAVMRFVYDGPDVLLDVTSGAVLRYLHGPAIDQNLASANGSEALWYLTDHLGSTTALTDSRGDLAETYDYDAFGQLVTSIDAASPRHLFSGREFDVETGFSFYRARYYESGSGRFLSEDPIGFSGGDLNLARYALGSPVRWKDSSGLAVETPWDVVNVGLGTASLGVNLATGNYGAAAVDFVGLAYDSFATVIPGLPAGAGAAIRTRRLGKLAKSADDLIAAACKLDPSDRAGQLTKAGRALQKHGGRVPSAFPGPKGSPAKINDTAEKVVRDLINHPKAVLQKGNNPRFGPVIDVMTPNGGARWSSAGDFIGLLQP